MSLRVSLASRPSPFPFRPSPRLSQDGNLRFDHGLEGRPRLAHITAAVVHLAIAVRISIGPIARHSSLRQSPNAVQTRGAVHVLYKEPSLRQTNFDPRV